MQKIMLNIGSGQRPFGKPFINIDKQSKWNPDIVCDFGSLQLPYTDEQVDLIVLHHVLEHYGCGEADKVLQECLRLLKPSAPLIVSVPDMHELSTMWREGRLNDQVYMTNVYGAYMGDEADRHKWGYTRRSLTQTLLAAGFSTVQVFRGRIEEADIAQAAWILTLEAKK
jgi:predicted SAM-dependent methyltransferase